MMLWCLLSVAMVVLPKLKQSRGKSLVCCYIAISLICCSPEVVSSDEEDELITPKARSSTKPQKTGTKKESANKDKL